MSYVHSVQLGTENLSWCKMTYQTILLWQYNGQSKIIYIVSWFISCPLTVVFYKKGETDSMGSKSGIKK